MPSALDRRCGFGALASLAQTTPEAAQVPSFWFGSHAGARLVSIVNGHDQVRSGRGARNLGLLAELADAGRLDPGIATESPWTEAPDLLAALERREISGKAGIRMSAG